MDSLPSCTYYEHVIRIDKAEGDDEHFFHLVRSAVRGAIEIHQPEMVRVVRIDNWFSRKWFRFSGKCLGALGVQKYRLTLPPFVPNRIILDAQYRLVDSEPEKKKKPMKSLHRWMPSDRNLMRYADREFPNFVLAWFSCGSALSKIGSLMVYETCSKDHDERVKKRRKNEGGDGWYAEFAAEREWEPTQPLGISAAQLAHLISTGEAWSAAKA